MCRIRAVWLAVMLACSVPMASPEISPARMGVLKRCVYPGGGEDRLLVPLTVLRARGGGYDEGDGLFSSGDGGEQEGGWGDEPGKKDKRSRKSKGATRGRGGEEEGVEKRKDSSKLKQIKHARERIKKKAREAMDPDDENIEEIIKKQGQNLDDLTADFLPMDPIDRALNGMTDLAEEGKFWELASGDEEEMHLPGKRQLNKAWDKDRGVSSGEEEALMGMGVNPALYKRPGRGGEDGEASSDDSYSDTKLVEEMAVVGIKWDAQVSKFVKRMRADTLEETVPYQKALGKAIAAEDYERARLLLRNIGGLNITNSRAVGAGLVKLVRGIVLDGKVAVASEPGKVGMRELLEPARAVMKNLVEISRQEMMTEEVDDDEGSSVLSRSSSSSSAAEREEEATRNFAQRIFGEEDDEIFSSAFQSRDDVIKMHMSKVGQVVFNAAASRDWEGLKTGVAELEGEGVKYHHVSEEVVHAVKRLRSCGDAGIEARAQTLVMRWRDEAKRARSEASEAVNGRQRGKGVHKRGSDVTFDYKNVIKKCVDFYDGGRCVSRSSMGNPKVSVFVLWGSREAGRDVGGVSEWAVRVDRCAGSSMHIGCMSRPYPKEKGHDEDEEWAMAGVVGEAYNMKYTAYLLGSQGMVWECTAKGPRSLTQQVMDHIGEDGSKCEETVVANGQKTYKVKTSNALRFDSRGSVVSIVLDRDAGDLKFRVNQSPPFVLSGVTGPVRPFVALKAVGDCVTLVNPKSLAQPPG